MVDDGELDVPDAEVELDDEPDAEEDAAARLAIWAEKAPQSKPLAEVSVSERSTTANWMLIIAMLR